jgi:hypothetical protein
MNNNFEQVMTSFAKVPSKYEIFIRTSEKKHLFVGAFSKEAETASVLLKLATIFNINSYSVQAVNSRILTTEALEQGQIRLKYKTTKSNKAQKRDSVNKLIS